MKCNNDCFNCVYSDCIQGVRSKAVKNDRRDYQHEYYLRNRERLLNNAKQRYLTKRGEKHELIRN